MNRKQQYIVKRLGLTILSLYLIATLLFLIFRVMPGDPANQVVTMSMSQADRQALRAQFGLDKPLHVQYWLFIVNLLQGNFGISFFNAEPVLPLILNKSLNTISIVLPAVLLAFTLGPLIGAFFASRRDEPIDNIGSTLMLIAYAAPVFWTGMLFIMLFSFQLGWLPSSGMHSPGYQSSGLVDRFVSIDFLRHAILPITVTAAWWITIPALIMRNNVLDILSADFVQLNRAEGLSESRILYHHAARNALLPVLHRAALAVGLAFGGGSVIIETVFSWPGLGRTMWFAVLRQDYPLAQGALFFIAFMVVLMNFLVDIVSVYIDPRVAVEEEVNQ